MIGKKTRLVTIPSINTPIKTSPGFEKKELATHKLDIMGLCGFGCSYCSSNAGNYLRINQAKFAALTREQLGVDALPATDPDLSFRWGDFEDQLDRQLATKPIDGSWGRGRTLVFSQLTDAFSPWAVGDGLTERTLTKILQRTSFRIRVLTKSAVVGSSKWVGFFQAHSGRFVVGLSVGSLDRQWAEAVEIGTSSPEARLGALRRLQDAGVPTFGMLCPVFPDAMSQLDDLVDSIRPSRCETIWAEPFNDRNNWQAVRDGYREGSEGRAWLDAIYGDGAPSWPFPRRGRALWSYYARDLYRKLKRRAVAGGWLHKLKYLLYEGDIMAVDAPYFEGLHGVLLQSKPAHDGWSQNPHMAAVQIQSWDGLEEVGSFQSFEEWVNTAARLFRDTPQSTFHFFDMAGRRCNQGSDFARARDENAFPVTYYKRRAQQTDPVANSQKQFPIG